MSLRHSAAVLAVTAVERVVGRRQLLRAARFTLNQARLDAPGSAAHNGEHALQRWLLAGWPIDRPVVAFDIGANAGSWSTALLSHAARTGQAVWLHAFEPTASTFATLAARLPASATATLNRLTLSSVAGQAELGVAAPGADPNPRHPLEPAGHPVQTVAVTTVDEYAQAHGVTSVDLIKINSDGHDFQVLCGAGRLLRERRIGAVQFEYNHRWVPGRQFLRDVFALVAPFGYRVGKLTRRGVELYPGWDPELETYPEGNYVAARADVADRLPRVG